MRRLVVTATIALLFILAAYIPLQAFANDELTFTVGSSASASGGETVIVPINVSGNPGFMVVGLVVTYDPNVLEITNVTAPVSAMPLNSQFALTTTPGTQWIHLINTNFTDWSGNGAVVNIAFNVKTTAAAGESPISLAFVNSPDGTPVTAAGNILRGARAISGKVNITSGATRGGTETPPPAISPTPSPAPTPIPASADANPTPSLTGRLPQTGQLIWLIPLLFAFGIIVLIWGLSKKRKGRK
jgi:hypothetical protein